MSDHHNQVPATQQPTVTHLQDWIRLPPCERPAATLAQGSGELTACLTLVAPTGMTEEERTNWLQVARKALSGIPADLLARGCQAARLTCRFPSEIVPAIMDEIGEEWRRRQRFNSQAKPTNAPRLTKPEYVSHEEAKSILASVGLSRGQ